MEDLCVRVDAWQNVEQGIKRGRGEGGNHGRAWPDNGVDRKGWVVKHGTVGDRG